MKYKFWYSYPTKNRVAISDWREGSRVITAKSKEKAREILRKYLEDNIGTWIYLDSCEID